MHKHSVVHGPVSGSTLWQNSLLCPPDSTSPPPPPQKAPGPLPLGGGRGRVSNREVALPVTTCSRCPHMLMFADAFWFLCVSEFSCSFYLCWRLPLLPCMQGRHPPVLASPLRVLSPCFVGRRCTSLPSSHFTSLHQTHRSRAHAMAILAPPLSNGAPCESSSHAAGPHKARGPALTDHNSGSRLWYDMIPLNPSTNPNQALVQQLRAPEQARIMIHPPILLHTYTKHAARRPMQVFLFNIASPLHTYTHTHTHTHTLKCVYRPQAAYGSPS